MVCKCNNSRCVTKQESEQKYLKPGFKIVSRNPLTLRCVYCEHGTEPKYIASTEWHEGKLSLNSTILSKVAGQIKSALITFIAFDSAIEAKRMGSNLRPDLDRALRRKLIVALLIKNARLLDRHMI